ncbi:hypothetical protein, partial [Agromyces humi]|uniref:hypothetical protein n=1 Tax=Agromyces humi TaxID=1766800 RepID=UPI0019394BB8
MWNWLGQKGLFVLVGGALAIILITNLTMKTSANLFIVSAYDLINMIAFIHLAMIFYFVFYVCADLSAYRYFGVFTVVIIFSAIPLVLFGIRIPLFTETKFHLLFHLVVPLALALMMAILSYPMI